MAPDSKPLRIGVFFEEVQMSDLAGLDVFGSLSTSMIELAAALLPYVEKFRPVAKPVEFLYISSSMESATCATNDMRVVPTHTYANAPRDLDILFVGGPDPSQVKDESLQFMREASKETKVILTTCTGGVWLAKSGVLDGKKATTNRGFLPMAKTFFPNVEWQDQRWVIEKGHSDGAVIWTGGGAGCGIDMVVEYAKQNFDNEFVEFACMGLEFDFKGKGQFYAEPAPTFSQ